MVRATLKPLILLVFLTVLPTAAVQSEELVRDASLIETTPIQGVTLATPPKEAVQHLLAAGYRAGTIKTFEDWTEPELLLERGGPGAPEGESWVTLRRFKGRLIQITEQTNQPKKRFDATAQIGAVQDHFGIDRDDRKCRANAHGSGHCRVQDAAKTEEVDLVFGIQVLSITMNRYATRKKDLNESYK